MPSSAVEWSNVCLAVLTAVYIVYTGLLSKHAKASAASSQRAAEAAERSAALSEATISVDFSVDRVMAVGSETVVSLRADSASVYVAYVSVRVLVIPQTTGGVREVTGSTTWTEQDVPAPHFVHNGEDFQAVLNEPLKAGDTVFGHATVRYGFSKEQQARDRLVTIGKREVTHL